MASVQQSAASRQQLILHHLSDLRYEDTVENRQHDMLVRYQGYLGSLPAERRPDIVVITGNLTTTGKAKDLRAVATTLRICFAPWVGHLHERVFVVPGPCDVGWEDSATIGLQSFYEIFDDFALPYHTPIPSGQDTPASGQQNFIGYPIDTCYSPNELNGNLSAKFNRYSKSYRRFIKRHRKLNTRWLGLWKRPWRLRRRERERARAEQLESLRKLFLDLTEGGQLVDLRTGRITQPDLERYERWAQPIIQNPSRGAGDVGPLKILITHHPFAIQAEHYSATDTTQILQSSFKQVAKTARTAGFHLALHGHVHNPQLLTDMLLIEGPDHLQPIRQMGAASLSKTGVFNEIVAVARDGNGESAWRLDLRLVNLKASGTADLEAPSLLNSAETADKKIEQLTRDATQRSMFEQSMEFAMRRFSEQVHQAQGTPRQDWPKLAPLPQEWSNMAPLPQDAMQLIRDVVDSVIFSGYDVRVRLLLKSKENYSDIPRLIPTYLAPAVMEGPDALVYPASVASWALILGRTLMYPAIKSQSTDVEDHEWLRRTGKFDPILSALKALMQDAAAKSYPGKEALDRYQTLHTNLEAIRGATVGASDARIAGEHIYQPTPGGSPSLGYPNFICVPYPMRPRSGAPPALPETMVLDIAVRRADQLDGHRATRDFGSADPFTRARVEMLETLAELIGMMLTTSSALGRPRGVWDDRYVQ